MSERASHSLNHASHASHALVERPRQDRVPPPERLVHHTQAEDFTLYQPAGFVLRWYAITLDVIFYLPLNVLVHMPFNRYLERLEAYGFETRSLVLNVLLTAIPLLLYFITPTVLYGQTLGKRIVGVRVVRAGFGADLSVGTVIFRETVGKVVLSVLSLGIGLAMPIWTKRKRALHDYVAETQVITYRQR